MYMYMYRQGGNYMLSTGQSGLPLGKFLSSLAKINQVLSSFIKFLSSFYQDFIKILIKFL